MPDIAPDADLVNLLFDATSDHNSLAEMGRQFAAIIAEAARREREACAEIARAKKQQIEQGLENWQIVPGPTRVAEEIEAAIWARSDASQEAAKNT
jgi:hypothetical protein